MYHHLTTLLLASTASSVHGFFSPLRGPLRRHLHPQQQQQQQQQQSSLHQRRARQVQRMARTTSEDLIPREVLFGNPEFAGPSLSPDGALLAFLAPSKEDGVLNAWVRKVGAPSSDGDRMVTADSVRGIRGVSWAEDLSLIHI